MSERVLVTGAGSGLGKALALHYARAGWRVAAADIDEGRAQAAVAELRATGAEAEAFVCDVGSDASMDALREGVRQRFGGVDHLVNNAGVASAGDVVETSMEDWRWMLEINLLGVVRGCRAFVPDMVAQGRGHVINIASFAALAGAPGLASYAVAKGGVVTVSESLRAEMAVRTTGVGVSVVCPAFFQTNLLQNFRGPEQARRFAGRMMANSGDNAESVARQIYEGARRGRFLILPTAREPMRWRLKRWLPETYFKKLVAGVRAAQGRVQ
jgi:NAD(P)-dependent dehydrogenase (short-subunit alcohol dehydrogenase family)